MLVKPITLSSKGQIALPKDIVKHLNSKALKLEILNDNEVKIVPIRDVAGRLSAYGKNVDTDDFNKLSSFQLQLDVLLFYMLFISVEMYSSHCLLQKMILKRYQEYPDHLVILNSFVYSQQ